MQKKLIVWLALLFAQNIILQAAIPITSQTPKVTAYQLCIIVKELIYAHTILPFWIDFEKARHAKIYCDGCLQAVDSFTTYGNLIARGKGHTVLILKKLWHRSENIKIEHFMCKISNQLQIPCIPCMAFHGWHRKIE